MSSGDRGGKGSGVAIYERKNQLGAKPMKTAAIIAQAMAGKKTLSVRAGRTALLATVMAQTLWCDAGRLVGFGRGLKQPILGTRDIASAHATGLMVRRVISRHPSRRFGVSFSGLTARQNKRRSKQGKRNGRQERRRPGAD